MIALAEMERINCGKNPRRTCRCEGAGAYRWQESKTHPEQWEQAGACLGQEYRDRR